MRLKSAPLARLFLLAGSLFFYGCWKLEYLALIILSVIVTWVSGLLMEGRGRGQKRLVIASSLAVNVGLLFFFKYYGFFTASLLKISAGALTMPAFNVLLPVGISFYTFQALGYSIDVYRGGLRAERDFISYALFVTFFPQLVAGPIERTSRLLPQFKVNHGFDYERVSSGLRLAAWGMFKKVVIADRLALYVNAVYGAPASYDAGALFLAAFFFAFQIYCDFSGYSDIAIGTARVLGFNLMSNFRQPYFAASISDFWRRWHISLSTWFKDYLYIPLGGGRKGALRQKINLMITFLLSGLWHGAAWHFVIWGALHGLFQIAERCVDGVKKSACPSGTAQRPRFIGKAARVCATFALVCFAWIFFRAASRKDAVLIISKLARLVAEAAGFLRELPALGLIGVMRKEKQLLFQFASSAANLIQQFDALNFWLSCFGIAVLLFHDIAARSVDVLAAAGRKPLALRWAGYYALLFTILLGWNSSSAQFIYFTF
ncbi:MAG: MBOAT family protein [Spirochaetaceae bacterium]|nr:MBOAT family protein [Spirochaetaceae bacterium]